MAKRKAVAVHVLAVLALIPPNRQKTTFMLDVFHEVPDYVPFYMIAWYGYGLWEDCGYGK